MEKNKMETYLGFCIRARKIIFGTEMISRQKKGVQLLIFDGGMGANSLKVIRKAHETLGCPLVRTDDGVLGELVHRPNVKAVAITDESLAKAMLSSLDAQTAMKLYSGGNN